MLCLVALALLFAGCLGGPTGPSNAATPTPDSPQPNAVPGIANDTLADSAALVDANRAGLAETGGELRVTTDSAEGAVGYRVRFSEGLTPYTVSSTNASEFGRARTLDIWTNETSRTVRVEGADTVDYRVVDRETTQPNSLSMLERYLAMANFSVTGVTQAGHVVLRPDAAAQTTDQNHSTPISSVDGRLVVSEAGLVQNLSIDVVRDDQQSGYGYELMATDISAVDRPAWLDEVPASASLDPDLELDVDNETALVLRNQGGDTVPAGTTVTLSMNDSDSDATLDSSLAAGETRYAAIDSSNGALRISIDRPTAAEALQLQSPISVTVRTDDGVTLLSAGMGWSSSSASSGGSDGS